MNWSRLRGSGNENVFKGSQLVSSVLERHRGHFRSRAAALKFCRQQFRDGVIRGVFGADRFEDSVQLYTWHDPDGSKMTSFPERTSYPERNSRPRYGLSSADVTLTKRDLQRQGAPMQSAGETSSKRSPTKGSMFSPPMNSYFNDLEADITDETDGHVQKHITSSHHHYPTTLNLQRASTASSESSVDILSHSYHQRHKEKHQQQHINTRTPFAMPVPSQSRDYAAIPEEAQEEPVMERTGTSTEYDGSSSIPRSVTTDSSNPAHEMDNVSAQRRWQEYQNSFSDNEKQLIEQMKRMKKEHSHILRTYEDRINKLMAKMHELRSIAEMLENSSTKSSPYGMINSKPGILNFLGSKPDGDRKGFGDNEQQPPPLPPRPGRANRLNPNKPMIKTCANMKALSWIRIILKDDGEEAPTIWHTMAEPQLDPEEVERLFSNPEASPTDGATLYDDLIIRRGRSRQQLVSIYDTERSKRIVICMKCLRATLNDVISTVSSLDTSQINHDGLAELVELLSSARDIEKILYHVRKKGAGYLDHPEYLVFELSKVDHFKDRLEFIRFRFKTQWHLFEIDQQLRELHTACNEVTNSMSLKNLLETLLAVGNYLNSATDMGQADGFRLDVINKLKETQDRDGKGTLLEFVLKTYCQIYENEVDMGCPTRFRLPEPSNMRHAAQVSFEGIADALSNLNADLKHVRDKLLDPTVNVDTMRPMDSFRVTAENFFSAAMEVIGDQSKVLMDTRDLFDKTVAYFLVEDRDMTPQQFFHIWAVFLHDCKYYWKLAHRRITRERFELEFKYKGQMSSVSLQGGYGSFRAGVQAANVPSDPKTSTTGRKGNKWMKTPEDPNRPVVPPKPARANMEPPPVEETDSRSPSPKPITSTPPTSAEVYKPLPKTPIVTSPVPNGVVPNYENQSECDRYLAKQTKTYTVSTHADQVRSIPYPVNDSPRHGGKEKKTSQNFSLKAWLKREREQVRKGVESDSNESPQDPAKAQHSSKSFSRLKNSMMQRFSGTSHSKKNDPSHKRPPEQRDIISPQRANRYDREPSTPYDVLRNNYVESSQQLPAQPPPPQPPPREQETNFEPEVTTQVDSLGFEYKTTISDAVISPIDDPDGEPSPILPNGHFEHSPSINKATVYPTQHNPAPQHGYRSDMNNNEPSHMFTSPNKDGPWQRNGTDETDIGMKRTRHPPPPMTSPQEQMAIKPQGAESKQVRGEAVPVYTAKIINNYENQGKFENLSPAVRQHAQAVEHPGDLREANTPNYSPYARFQQSRQKDNGSAPPEPPRHYGDEHTPKSQNGQKGSNGYSRYDRRTGRSSKQGDTPRKRHLLDNHNYLTPGNRVPMNVQSIGSLIDKFDKYNNNDSVDGQDPSAKHDTVMPSNVLPPKQNGMNGTPQRGQLNGEPEETSPPLPPRSKHMSPRSDSVNPVPKDSSTPNTGTSYSSPSSRTQKHMSPLTRLDNLTMSFGSPQSVYSTPQSNGRLADESNNNSMFHTPSSNISYSHRSGGGHLRNNEHESSNQNDFLQQSGTSGTSSGYHPGSTTSTGYHPGSSAGAGSGYNPYTTSGYSSYASPNCDGDQPVEKDEGYRNQLRKAANQSQSAFDRYSKSPQYTGRPSIGSVSSYTSPGVTPYSTTAVVKPTIHNNEEVSYMAI